LARPFGSAAPAGLAADWADALAVCGFGREGAAVLRRVFEIKFCPRRVRLQLKFT
jgi:hypothetical protein